MRKQILLVLAALVLGAGAALGQTNTPTSTPTNTPTVTPTVTNTPGMAVQFAVGQPIMVILKGASVAFVLPKNPTQGMVRIIQNSGTASMNIYPDGTDTVKGTTSYALPNGDAVTFIYYSGDWKKVSFFTS